MTQAHRKGNLTRHLYRYSRWRILWLGIALSTLAEGQTTFTWDGGPDSSYDGAWNNPLNWTADSGFPVSSIAKFDVQQTYTVGGGIPASLHQLVVTAGDVRLDMLPGTTLALTDRATIADATLRIKDGILSFADMSAVNYNETVRHVTFRNSRIFLEGATLSTSLFYNDLVYSGDLSIEGHGQVLLELFQVPADHGNPVNYAPSQAQVHDGEPRVTFSARGGDLYITNPASPGYGVDGDVDTGSNTVRIESTGNDTSSQATIQIYGKLLLGGGTLAVNSHLTIDGSVLGHGTILLEHSAALNNFNGMSLDGDLLIDGSGGGSFFQLFLRGDTQVGSHRLEIRTPSSALPIGVAPPLFLASETADSPDYGRLQLAGGELVVPDTGLRLSSRAHRISGEFQHDRIEGFGVIRGPVTARLLVNESPLEYAETDPSPWLVPTGGLTLNSYLDIGDDTVTLLSSAPAMLAGGAQIAGGRLISANGLTLGEGKSLLGFGAIRAPLLNTNGLIGDGVLAVTSDFNVGSHQWTLLSEDPVSLQAKLIFDGASVQTLHGLDVANNSVVEGWGFLDSSLTGLGQLSLDGGNFQIGLPTSADAIDFGGAVAVGSHSLILRDADTAHLSGPVTLAGGSIIAPNGLSVEAFSGFGSVPSVIAGDGEITATGPLTLGDASAEFGFLFDGTLNVGEHHVTLLGGNRASFLGTLTTLAGGVLESPTGFSVDTDESISGRGLILGALLGSAGSGALAPSGVFSFTAPLALGGGSSWVLADGFATFSGPVSLAGGTLFGSTGAGLKLTSTGSLSGHGALALPIDAASGTVSVAGGVLDFQQGATFGGNLSASGGGVLRLSGGNTVFETGVGADLASLQMTGGTAYVAAGAGVTAASVTVSGGGLEFAAGTPDGLANASLAISGTGTATINGAGALPAATSVSGDGTTAGTLTGSGDWLVSSGHTLDVSRGTISGSGTLTIASGAQLDIIGNGATLDRDIDNLGTTRLNAVVTPGFFLGGNATLTNFGSGVFRVLDAPLDATDSNYNRLRATGLDIINAGTMTIGALTPQTGNAAQPWFWLNQSFTNTGSLALLQSAELTVEGAFTNTGAISLANGSRLTALGGGTMQGTLALGPEAASFAVFRDATVHDTGATFTGTGGFVSIESGTLYTPAGVYTPSVNLEFLDNPWLPDTTGLAVANGRWLRFAGSAPALPVQVGSGGTFELMGGTNTNAITVAAGGTMRLGDTYSNPTNHTRPDEPNVLNAVPGQPGRGDIDNHGTLTIVPGTVTGTGRILNRADGATEAISDSLPAALEIGLAVENEGLLTLWTHDTSNPYTEFHGGVRFGNITNAGTAVFKATEVSADPYDDVRVEIGDYTQTAGATTLETTGAGLQYLPYVQAASFSILAGTVNATGRLVAPLVGNAGLFQVGTGGLHVTGAFSNNNGGDLRLTGELATTGAFSLQSGSRLLLDGAGAGVTQTGASIFASDFTTPAGATVELRNRSLVSGATMTTHGTLIIGSGATMQRTSGFLAGNGEVRVTSGGSLVLRGSFDGSGGGPINIEAGGSLALPSRDYGIFRFHNRSLTNHGTATHSTASLSLNAGTTITNHGTWSVALPGTGDVGGYITESGQTAGGSFINYGTFNQNGTNALYFSNGPAFTNHGTVNVNSGLLRIRSVGTFAGTSVANIAAGATLELRDGTVNIQSGARFQGAGTLSLGDAGQHILNGDIYADQVSFGGGTIQGTHTLHGTWNKSYSGGSMATTGTTTIAADGTWNFQASTNLRGRSFINQGTVNRADGQLEFSPDTLIQNHGTWNDANQGNSYASQNSPQGGLFENFGTFNKTATGTLSFGSGSGGPGFTNHALVNVNQGILSLRRASTFTGTSVVNLAAGATLELRDGTNYLESGARFQGAGTLSLGDAGQHHLNGDIYTDQVSFGGGTIQGTHTLHGTWNKSYSGGSMATTGTTTIAADGTWSFQAGTNLRGRSFINQGTVNRADGQLEFSPDTLIQNHGTWNDTNQGNSYVSQNSPQGGLFENFGTFNKTGTGTLSFGSGYGGPGFTNRGTLNVNQGIFSIHRTSTFTGTSVVNLAAGTTLELRDGTNYLESGARFQGAGNLGLGDAGQHHLNGDIYADHANVGGGTLNGTHTLHGNWILNYYPNIATTGTTTIAADGTWQFTAVTNNLSNRSFINDGAVTRTNGGLVLNAATTIRNNGTWTDSSGAPISSSSDLQGLFENTGTFIKTGANTTTFDYYNSPVFSNLGTVDVQQGTLQLYQKLLQHTGSTLTGGTWIVRSGAILREDYSTAYTINQADVTLHGTGDFSPLNSLTTNAGTLRLLDGKVWNTSAAFTNSGTLIVGTGSSFGTSSTFTNSGTLNLLGAFSAASLTNAGSLTGVGTFTGSLVSAGVLAPGNSPGLLAVTGNLTLQATSDLLMELGGLAEGVSYDSIDVGGTLTFGGDLVVSLINSFTPATGATFNLFDATTLTGTFATVSLPALTAGLSWDTSGLYSGGVLSVTGTAIPEPSTYAAMAGALALGLAVWRRPNHRPVG